MKVWVIQRDVSDRDYYYKTVDSIWTDKAKAKDRVTVLRKIDKETEYYCYEVESDKEDADFEELIE